MFYIGYFIFKNERFAHSLIFGERCERITQVAHQKWAMWADRSSRWPKMSNVSESLRALTKNERPLANRSPKMSQWANRSFFWANCSLAHFFAKNEQLAQKTDEHIPSPAFLGWCSDLFEQNFKHCIFLKKRLWISYWSTVHIMYIYTILFSFNPNHHGPLKLLNCHGLDGKSWFKKQGSFWDPWPWL